MHSLKPDAGNTEALLQQIRAGNKQAVEELLVRHRPWLRHLVEMRLDPRLRQRLDPSDVVQDVQLEVSRRLEDYLEREPMSFHLWLRQTACENLNDLHRKHLQAECRSVGREVFLPDDSSLRLAQMVLGTDNPPDQELVRQELAVRVRQALNELPETDREMLVMRFFEGLENQEISQLLGLQPATASKRFGRALFRLRALLLSHQSGESNP